MNHQTVNGWALLSLLMSTLVLAYPQQQPQQQQQQPQQEQPQSITSSSPPNHIAAQYLPKTAQQQAEYQQHHQQFLRQQQQHQPRIQHYQVPSAAQWQQPQQHFQHQQQQQFLQQQQQHQYRKFAEKPNNLKKVSLDDIDDDNNNQLNQIDSNAFSWTNMLGQVMQMIFANANNAYAPPTKSDDIDGGGNSVSPSWTNVLSAGLKIISAFLGANTNDNIDKVDNGNVSPVQSILTVVLSGLLGNKDPDQVNIMAKQAGEFISIVVNLLDALKTSFSHRSIAARTIGKKDSFSDMGVASITMLKGYVKTMANSSEKCMQKYVCEANSECKNDIGVNSIFCQMGSYATSYVLERQTGAPFETFYEAGRLGRHDHVDCQKIYVECSEI